MRKFQFLQNWISQNKIIIFTIAVILFSPMPALFYIPAGEVIGHGLFYPWPSTEGMLAASWNSIFAWMHGPNWDFSTGLYNFYVYLSLSLLHDPNLAQNILFYIGLVTCISGVVVFARAIGLPLQIGMLAGLFYIYSAFVMSGLPLAPFNIRVLPFYASTPWILVAFRQVLVERNLVKPLTFLIIITFFVATPGYSSPQYLIAHLFLLTGLAITNAFNAYDKTQSRKYWSRVLLALTVILLVNAWWLFPNLYHAGDVYSARVEPGFTDQEILSGASESILSVLLLGVPNYQEWMAYYRHPIYIIFLLALWFSVILAAFQSSFKAKMRPFLLLALATIFIIKGVSPPFSIVINTIFSELPFLGRLFRNPTYFGTIYVFLYSYLFAFGIFNLVLLLNKRCINFGSQSRVTIGYIFSFLIIMIYGGWLFISAAVASHSTVRIPQYFSDLVTFLNTPKESAFRIIELPINVRQSHFVRLDWGHSSYKGFPPLAVISDHLPLLEAPGQELIFPAEDQLLWLKMLGSRNISYIVFHEDAIRQDSGDIQILGNKMRVLKALEWAKEQKHIYENHSFGPVRIFTIDPQFFSQRVVLEGVPENTEHTFLKEGMQRSEMQYVALMLNPTKYKINVAPLNGDVNIRFSEAFSRGWKLYLECKKINQGNQYEAAVKSDGVIRLPSKSFDKRFFETWFRTPIPEDNHYMTAAGGNAWFLDAYQRCETDDANLKDVVILLEYEPQKAVYVGYAISGITALLLILFYFWYSGLEILSRTKLIRKVFKR